MKYVTCCNLFQLTIANAQYDDGMHQYARKNRRFSLWRSLDRKRWGISHFLARVSNLTLLASGRRADAVLYVSRHLYLTAMVLVLFWFDFGEFSWVGWASVFDGSFVWFVCLSGQVVALTRALLRPNIRCQCSTVNL